MRHLDLDQGKFLQLHFFFLHCFSTAGKSKHPSSPCLFFHPVWAHRQCISAWGSEAVSSHKGHLPNSTSKSASTSPTRAAKDQKKHTHENEL